MTSQLIRFQADSYIQELKFDEVKIPRRVIELLKNIEIVGATKENDIKYQKDLIRKEIEIDANTGMPKLTKPNKYSRLSLRIEWLPKDSNANSSKGGVRLSNSKSGLFKFNRDDTLLFIDCKVDKRKPDYSQIFLSRFLVYDHINENPFNIKVSFIKLPKSYGIVSDNSFECLVLKDQTRKQQQLNEKNNIKPPPATILVQGSKKKRDSLNDPIPEPVFEEDVSFDSPSIFPISNLPRETPHTFESCKNLDDNDNNNNGPWLHRRCDDHSHCTKEKYHLFNFYDFAIEITRLDGERFPKKVGEISFTIDMKYYFMHYFDSDIDKEKQLKKEIERENYRINKQREQQQG